MQQFLFFLVLVLFVESFLCRWTCVCSVNSTMSCLCDRLNLTSCNPKREFDCDTIARWKPLCSQWCNRTLGEMDCCNWGNHFMAAIACNESTLAFQIPSSAFLRKVIVPKLVVVPAEYRATL